MDSQVPLKFENGEENIKDDFFGEIKKKQWEDLFKKPRNLPFIPVENEPVFKVDDTTAERSVGKMLMSVIFERFCVLCTFVGLTNLTPTQCLQIPKKF